MVSRIYAIGVVISCVIILGAILIFSGNENRKAGPDESTANRNVYRNEKYGFEFSYPNPIVASGTFDEALLIDSENKCQIMLTAKSAPPKLESERWSIAENKFGPDGNMFDARFIEYDYAIMSMQILNFPNKDTGRQLNLFPYDPLSTSTDPIPLNSDCVQNLSSLLGTVKSI